MAIQQMLFFAIFLQFVFSCNPNNIYGELHRKFEKLKCIFDWCYATLSCKPPYII